MVAAIGQESFISSYTINILYYKYICHYEEKQEQNYFKHNLESRREGTIECSRLKGQCQNLDQAKMFRMNHIPEARGFTLYIAEAFVHWDLGTSRFWEDDSLHSTP